MMKRKIMISITALIVLLPAFSFAQGVADNIHSLQEVLNMVYDKLIVLSSGLIGVGQGLAGFGALWYIGSRVWKHIANAEPVDFYPLFRPFCLGFCIAFFPLVIMCLNGILKPIEKGTATMLHNSDDAIKTLLEEKQRVLKTTTNWMMYVGESGKGDREQWYKYTYENKKPTDETWYETIGNNVRFAIEKKMFSVQNSIKVWFSELMHIIYEAAALAINTLRTFHLIILAILGPLVLGISVYDGFEGTLIAWLTKYINYFLWVPVANVYGAILSEIQANLIKIDISQLHQTGETSFGTHDTGFIVFMIIGILGYLAVPSAANMVIASATGGGDAITRKLTSVVEKAGSNVMKNAFGK